MPEGGRAGRGADRLGWRWCGGRDGLAAAPDDQQGCPRPRSTRPRPPSPSCMPRAGCASPSNAPASPSPANLTPSPRPSRAAWKGRPSAAASATERSSPRCCTQGPRRRIRTPRHRSRHPHRPDRAYPPARQGATKSVPSPPLTRRLARPTRHRRRADVDRATRRAHRFRHHQVILAIGGDAAIPGLRPHRLGHTYGTGLCNGADPAQIQALMGHASLDTTGRYFRNPRELHQAGEEPQVARSERCRLGLPGPWSSAA